MSLLEIAVMADQHAHLLPEGWRYELVTEPRTELRLAGPLGLADVGAPVSVGATRDEVERCLRWFARFWRV